MRPAWTLVAALLTAPTAIVDSVVGVATLEPLQMLMPGQRIELGETGRVRIAYFASCVHETVRGGEVRIGVTASLASGDAVERITADCSVPGPVTGTAHAPAALVLRSGDAEPVRTPPIRIRTRTPLLVTGIARRVIMVREHPPGRSLFLPVGEVPFDFAAHGLALGAGETWRVCADDRCLRVWVDPHAAHAHGPVLERVIALP